MKAEAEQAKKELADNMGRISLLMEKIDELKFAADVHVECRYRAKKG